MSDIYKDYYIELTNKENNENKHYMLSLFPLNSILLQNFINSGSIRKYINTSYLPKKTKNNKTKNNKTYKKNNLHFNTKFYIKGLPIIKTELHNRTSKSAANKSFNFVSLKRIVDLETFYNNNLTTFINESKINVPLYINDEINQIKIESLELQIYKLLYLSLNNINIESIKELIPNGLDNNFIKTYEFNEEDKSILILIIPNLFDTLPYLNIETEEIITNFKTENISQILHLYNMLKDYQEEKKATLNYLNIVKNKFKEGTDIFKLFKDNITEMNTYLNSDNYKKYINNILSIVNPQLNFNVFYFKINESNNEATDNIKYTPYMFNIKEIEKNKKINMKLLKFTQEILDSYLLTNFPQYNNTDEMNDDNKYYNYSARISLYNIFNIEVKFINPFDKLKPYYHKIESSIKLSELLSLSNVNINEVIFNFDIKNDYLESDFKYKYYKKINYENNNLEQKESDELLFNNFKVINLSSTLWGSYDLIYFNRDSYYHMEFKSYLHYNKHANTSYLFFKIVNNKAIFPSDNKIDNIDKYFKSFPVLSYSRKYNMQINNYINNNLLKYYCYFMNTFLYTYYLYKKNYDILKNKENYQEVGDKMISNQNKDCSFHFCEKTNYYKIIEIEKNEHIKYKIIIIIYKLFVYHNKGKNYYRNLAWVFKIKDNIQKILYNDDGTLKHNENEVREYLTENLILRNKDEQNNKTTLFNILDFYNSIELKHINNELDTYFPDEKYFKYVHVYNTNVTAQLHIHLTKKTQYYYDPRQQLELMDFVKAENSMNTSRFYQYYKKDAKYPKQFEDNFRLLIPENILLTPLAY